MKPPASGVCRNPLLGIQPGDMQEVPVGVSLASFAPVAEGLLLCYVNGSLVSRLTPGEQAHVNQLEASEAEHVETWRAYCAAARNWHETKTQPGDVIHWHDEPAGREGFRTALSLALVVASIAGPQFAALAQALLVANVAYNIAVPPRAPEDRTGAPGAGVYSTSLAGNAARLDDPIWRNCGFLKITPPFAAQPYVEFLPSRTDYPTHEQDQYYYALFAVGVGEYDVLRAFIGKTSIAHFQDVLVAQYLAPGVQPSSVLANVVTSDEVQQIDLPEGIYSSAYAASRPGDLVRAIGFDVIAPEGLGAVLSANAGDEAGDSIELTVQWQVEIREIDRFGSPLGEWQILANEERTDNTNTPQRWGSPPGGYELSTPIRCEVRGVRTNEEYADAGARDRIQWVGLRAYLVKPAPLNPDAAHYEVVMRSSAQLSAVSQRDFSLLLQCKTETLDADLNRVAASFTRNPAWWLLDLWTNPAWGEGVPDSRVDLASIRRLALIADTRQDRFDFSFSTSMDSWEAAQLIARSMRARCFRKNGIYSVVRDELIDLPAWAFTPRNTQAGTMSMTAKLPGVQAANGVVVTYVSNVTWDLAEIECPCPGYSVANTDDPRFDPDLPPMDAPVYLQLDGVMGATHAEREGLYQAANMALRTTTGKVTAEMEGSVVTYLGGCRWLPETVGYSQSGDVAFWDPITLTMGLTEPPDWRAGEELLLTLRRDDGSLTEPVPVLAGPGRFEVVLPAAPDFPLVLDDGTRERPIYILGPDGGEELVKITNIADGGKQDGAQLFDLEVLVDDDRVHLADVHLLPGPGDIQDPIDLGGDDSSGEGGGMAALVRLREHDIQGGSTSSGGTDDGFASFSMGTDGVASWAVRYFIGSTASGTYAGEWINSAPVEPTVTALYEVFVDDGGAFAAITAAGGTVAGTVGSWVPMTSARTWSIAGTTATASPSGTGNGLAAELKVKIRRAGSTVVQETRNIALIVSLGFDGF